MREHQLKFSRMRGNYNIMLTLLVSISASCIRFLRLGPVPPSIGVHINIREARLPSRRSLSNSRIAGTGVAPAVS
jgi:hypothetical protein